MNRRCSRVGCGSRASATLTYVYADQMAVLGPLSAEASPHSYDLCERHAARITPPQGWLLSRVGLSQLTA